MAVREGEGGMKGKRQMMGVDKMRGYEGGMTYTIPPSSSVSEFS